MTTNIDIVQVDELSLQEAVKSFHEKPLPTHEKTALNKYLHFVLFLLLAPFSLNMNNLDFPGHVSSSSPGNRQLALELLKTNHPPLKTSAF